MATAKQELKRLCTELNSGNLAKVTIFQNRNFSEESGGNTVGGYVIDEKIPARILLCKKKVSYRDLILILLHEIGHVLDKNRYPKCNRLKIWSKYYFTSKELEKSKGYSKYIKFAFLHTEYIAEKYIPKLIKKLKVALDKPFTKKEIDNNNYSVLKIYKYEFIYGEHPTRRLKKLWLDQLTKKPKELTLEYVKDVNHI